MEIRILGESDVVDKAFLDILQSVVTVLKAANTTSNGRVKFRLMVGLITTSMLLIVVTGPVKLYC